MRRRRGRSRGRGCSSAGTGCSAMSRSATGTAIRWSGLWSELYEWRRHDAFQCLKDVAPRLLEGALDRPPRPATAFDLWLGTGWPPVERRIGSTGSTFLRPVCSASSSVRNSTAGRWTTIRTVRNVPGPARSASRRHTPAKPASAGAGDPSGPRPAAQPQSGQGVRRAAPEARVSVALARPRAVPRALLARFVAGNMPWFRTTQTGRWACREGD